MEMTARLTGDAKISTLKNDKQVVNFSVALNDSYKTKSSSEPKKLVTYVQCDYWVNTNIAKFLTKGTLIELQGRIGVNAYNSIDGEARARLTFHVNSIKFHGSSGVKNETPITTTNETAQSADDLPF